ncbi:MAG: cell wall-binding repeat-containing protein [Coriobacteriia bacterium]|nr:cell wall-binding repeat-containing protein [Coriobacteriia bacterium]
MSLRSRFRLTLAFALALALLPAVPAYGAISRTLVMDRVNRWIDAVVPYSQTGWADANAVIVTSPALGWRRDCSGFASMCWNLPLPGATTSTLPGYAERIEKEALQPGDLVLRAGVHAVIFGGWVDDTRREYWAYEMSSSQSQATGDGSVRRRTPYPYWNYDPLYLPYRLKDIADNVDYSAYITPIEGADRYATAVAASREAFPDGSVTTAIIASGENWPDALGASALAGAVEGPVLLTRAGALPNMVAAEITRLGATEVIIVGGEQAVSVAVADALDALGSIETTRLGGIDRYATATMVAREAHARAQAAGTEADTTVFVATGTNFPDALAASPIAYAHVRPILLTNPAGLSAETSATLTDIGVTAAVILGGESAVPSRLETGLAGLLGTDNVSRVSGEDRYATALALAAHADTACCISYSGAAVASGIGFADALGGGVMAGRLGTVLLLTPGDRLHPGAAAVLSKYRDTIGTVRCLGGTAAIETITRESIALMLQD